MFTDLRPLHRDGSLQLNLSKRFKPTGRSGITWLDLEAVESRYLLVSSFDSAISLYDAHSPSSSSSSEASATADQEHVALGRVDKSSRGGHKFTVSCVAWYPVDTGLFLSCSYDNQINVRPQLDRAAFPCRHFRRSSCSSSKLAKSFSHACYVHVACT